LPVELLNSPFRLLMTLLYQVRGETWRNDSRDAQLRLPQLAADLDAMLQTLDRRQLMMVLVRSVELLHGIISRRRAHHRTRLQSKRHRRAERRRAEQAYSDGRRLSID
jgi:hypothetical protein